MKLKSFIFFIIVIAAAIALFFGYENFQADKEVRAIELIPSTAILVYESDAECEKCMMDLKQSASVGLAQDLIADDWNDSLFNKVAPIVQSAEELTVSLHPIKKDAYDLIFYLEGADDLVKLTGDKGFRHTSRIFNGSSINELAYKNDIFSWVRFGEIYVGSFTSFLIEDVVRSSQQEERTLYQKMESVTTIPRIEGDAGNFYVQLNKVDELISLFTNQRPPLARLFGNASVLDVKSESNQILINGFSSSDTKSGDILSIFNAQHPSSFKVKDLISTRALLVNHFGITKGREFQQDRIRFLEQNRKQDSLQILQKNTGVDVSQLYPEINQEVILCLTDPMSNQEAGAHLIIATKNTQVWRNVFDNLSDKVSVDTPFVERFSEYEIREIPVFRFPEKMFWPLVAGFDQSFYTIMKGHVVISNDLSELKRLILDIEEDETWGKSVKHNLFLETTLLESNISVYVNAGKSYNALISKLHPRWQTILKRNSNLFKKIEFGAIQFSHLNNTFYTNIAITSSDVPNQDREKETRTITQFTNGTASLYAVRSHVSRREELLIQDSLNDLSLISSEGELLWKISLGDRIIGDVQQIDFFANGKLQYFFATANALHVVDRLGEYVAPYPIHISGHPIAFASVLDYDHSKKYRFLISDVDGNLTMFDKSGNALEGWRGRSTEGALFTSPQHHRIKARDYIIAIGADGDVNMMNRRGESIPGFPLELKVKPKGDYFLETGKGISDTYLVVVSENGTKVKFTVDGKIRSKETLVKTSVNTTFELVSKFQKDYVVVARDDRKITISDPTGKIIVTTDLIGSRRVKIRFYDFGSNGTYYVVVDIDQELAYVFDASGTLLTSPPKPAQFMELRPDDAGGINVFFAAHNTLTIEKL